MLFYFAQLLKRISVDGKDNTITMKNETPESIIKRLEFFKTRCTTPSKSWTNDRHKRTKASVQEPWQPYITYLDELLDVKNMKEDIEAALKK